MITVIPIGSYTVISKIHLFPSYWRFNLVGRWRESKSPYPRTTTKTDKPYLLLHLISVVNCCYQRQEIGPDQINKELKALIPLVDSPSLLWSSEAISRSQRSKMSSWCLGCPEIETKIWPRDKLTKNQKPDYKQDSVIQLQFNLGL